MYVLKNKGRKGAGILNIGIQRGEGGGGGVLWRVGDSVLANQHTDFVIWDLEVWLYKRIYGALCIPTTWGGKYDGGKRKKLKKLKRQRVN